MTGRLGPSVYLATVAEDLVLLDVEGDAYYCLPGAGLGLALAADGVTLTRSDPELRDELVQAGLVLLGPAPRDAVRAALPRPGTRDLRARQPPPVRTSDVGRMAAAAMLLYRHGHHGSLTRLLLAARAFNAPNDPGEDKVIDLATRCEQMIPWVPLQGECLFRSFLTLCVLRGAGASVSWIFGVQTWPFRAHCWLQRGDLVLNDGAEQVSGYTPIMVA
jgi:hypothetical protein